MASSQSAELSVFEDGDEQHPDRLAVYRQRFEELADITQARLEGLDNCPVPMQAIIVSSLIGTTFLDVRRLWVKTSQAEIDSHWEKIYDRFAVERQEFYDRFAVERQEFKATQERHHDKVKAELAAIEQARESLTREQELFAQRKSEVTEAQAAERLLLDGQSRELDTLRGELLEKKLQLAVDEAKLAAAREAGGGLSAVLQEYKDALVEAQSEGRVLKAGAEEVVGKLDSSFAKMDELFKATQQAVDSSTAKAGEAAKAVDASTTALGEAVTQLGEVPTKVARDLATEVQQRLEATVTDLGAVVR